MLNYPIAIMYVATLAAGVAFYWMWQVQVKKSYEEELKKFRQELDGLAASIGLMKRVPPTMRPPTMGG